jgi:hypothetical protein
MRWFPIIIASSLAIGIAGCHKPPEDVGAHLAFATGTEGDVAEIFVADGKVDIVRRHFQDVPFIAYLGWSEAGLLATAHDFYTRSLYHLDLATEQATLLSVVPSELDNASYLSFGIYGNRAVFVGQSAIHLFDLGSLEWSSVPFPPGVSLATDPSYSGVFLKEAAFFRDHNSILRAFDPVSDEFFSFETRDLFGWKPQCGAGDMLALASRDGTLRTYTFDHANRSLQPRASAQVGSSSMPYVALTNGENEWLLKGWDYGVFTTVHSSTLNQATWRIPKMCVWHAVEVPEQPPIASQQ